MIKNKIKMMIDLKYTYDAEERLDMYKSYNIKDIQHLLDAYDITKEELKGILKEIGFKNTRPYNAENGA